MNHSDVIGIDASRLSVKRLTGTETYSFELIKALARLESDRKFELYFNSASPPDRLPALGEAICIPFPRLWTHVRLSVEMARRRPGVLFVPAHVIPIVHPRSVVTIHDLGYLEHPETHPPGDLRMLDWSTRWSIRAATKVIAISQATKNDLQQHYRVPSDKIRVVHHGVSESLQPATRDEVAQVRLKYALTERYVLAVGTVQPRKNLARLAEAVLALNCSGERIELVVAGKPGWLSNVVERDISTSGASGNVRLLGYVEDRDLAALYTGAEVFCQPSLYEGFGMPVLEAMACGTPVVAANRSSLPEIGGDAAIYADPFSADSIAQTLSRVLAEPELRQNMIGRGLLRVRDFTWNRTATQTMNVLQEVLAT